MASKNAADKDELVWFFEDAGVPRGPTSAADLRSRKERGEIGRDTLVWHPSFPDWLPCATTQVVPKSERLPRPPMPIRPATGPAGALPPPLDSQSPLVILFMTLLTFGIYGLFAFFATARGQAARLHGRAHFETPFFLGIGFFVIGAFLLDPPVSDLMRGYRGDSEHVVMHILGSVFVAIALGAALKNRTQFVHAHRMPLTLTPPSMILGLWVSSAFLFGMAIVSSRSHRFSAGGFEVLSGLAAFFTLLSLYRWFVDHRRLARALSR